MKNHYQGTITGRKHKNLAIKTIKKNIYTVIIVESVLLIISLSFFVHYIILMKTAGTFHYIIIVMLSGLAVTWTLGISIYMLNNLYKALKYIKNH